jgi:hypothetical protein
MVAFYFYKKGSNFALVAWSGGIVSAFGAMGREIESRQGSGW